MPGPVLAAVAAAVSDSAKHVRVVVGGEPVGKGRPRHTKTGRVYTPRSTREYERRIAAEWVAAGALTHGATRGLTLFVTAIYTRPKAHFRKHGGLSAAGKRSEYPTTTTDLDNIVKIASDALNGLAYIDDRQINTIVATRRWSFGAADPEGLVIDVFDKGGSS